MFYLPTFDKSKKATNWISTEVLTEKVEPFHASLALITCNLANVKVNLKLINFVLVPENDFCIVY